MQDLAARTSVLALRWVARLWSLATILLVAAFIVGEGVNVSARAHAVGFVLFPFGICIGMAFAWAHELAGGAITVGCLAAFYVVHLITAGSLPGGIAWLALAAPGFLFLITWALSRDSRSGTVVRNGATMLLVLLLVSSAFASSTRESLAREAYACLRPENSCTGVRSPFAPTLGASSSRIRATPRRRPARVEEPVWRIIDAAWAQLDFGKLRPVLG